MKTSLELRELARGWISKALVLLALVPCTWNSRVEGTGSSWLALEVPPCRESGGSNLVQTMEDSGERHGEQSGGEAGWGVVAPRSSAASSPD